MKRKLLVMLIVLFLRLQVTMLLPKAKATQSQTSHQLTGIEPKALLERVAETYRNLKRYQFDFTLKTDIRSEAGRKPVETHIDLTMIRPQKLRMLISGGLGEIEVYSDGAVSWVFVPP